jgi:MYXO-CTERM domain-containing protein
MNLPTSRIVSSAAVAVLLATAGSARATSVDAATSSLVEAEDVQVVEGTGDNRTAVVAVQLRYDSTAAQTVDYRVLPGTATAGLDYLAISDGTLVFGPGETKKTLVVPIVADAIPECDEGFTVRLQHWFLGAPMDVHVLILDDDGYDGGTAGCPPAFPPGSSADPDADAAAVGGTDGAIAAAPDSSLVVERDAGVADPSPANPPTSPLADASTSQSEPKGSSGCSIAATGSHPPWLLVALALVLFLRSRLPERRLLGLGFASRVPGRKWRGRENGRKMDTARTEALRGNRSGTSGWTHAHQGWHKRAAG